MILLNFFQKNNSRIKSALLKKRNFVDLLILQSKNGGISFYYPLFGVVHIF